MTTSVERYNQKFSKARELYEKGSDVMPGASPASHVAFPFPHLHGASTRGAQMRRGRQC